MVMRMACETMAGCRQHQRASGIDMRCDGRVLVEKLVDAPVQGTFKAKVTSAGGGADQIIQGDMLMIRNKDADITSIKLTNDEDDSDGVALPILVILGGI